MREPPPDQVRLAHRPDPAVGGLLRRPCPPN